MTPVNDLEAMAEGFTKIYEGLAIVMAATRRVETRTLDWAASAVGDADVARLSGPLAEDPPAAPETTPEPEPEPEPEPAVTLETVRAELARLAKAGQKPLVKQLIIDHGGTKLTNVPPENLPALYEKAKNLD